jgi:hypothetical protein
MRPGKLYEEGEKCPRPVRINSPLLAQGLFSFQLIRPLDFLWQQPCGGLGDRVLNRVLN